eukprot:NODE_52_length_30984_cov_1.383358.p18 type:complete len:279 gc:universal NODE_52_length_30984_cov_1.383358:16728-17564(+)
MTLYVHEKSSQVYTDIVKNEIYKTSQLVKNFTGMVIQPNKAIVGKNAFAHESGIHQDGVLKNAETYEIINPEIVGIPKNSIVLGKHSGRNALKSRVAELGFILKDIELDEIFKTFKKLADSKKNITDDDLISILTGEETSKQFYELKSLQIVAGTSALATVSVEILKENEQEAIADAAVSRNGALSAIFSCLDRIVASDNIVVTLDHYQVTSVTEGGDSIGQVSVKVRSQVNEKSVVIGGHANDVDVLIASAKAYLKALSRVKLANGRNETRDTSSEI